MSARPFTDAFGTRLEVEALRAGLERAGLSRARLTFTDEGVTLAADPPDPRADDVARGATWLVSKLSPLTSLRLEALESGASGVSVEDARRGRFAEVHLAEAPPGEPEALAELARSLVSRIPPPGTQAGPARVRAAQVDEPSRAAMIQALADALGDALEGAGLSGATTSLGVLVPAPGGLGVRWPEGEGASLFGVAYLRPGGSDGVRPAVGLALSRDADAIRWLADTLTGGSEPPPFEILLEGLAWRVARRPTLAVVDDRLPIRVDPDRCISCEACARVCPVDYLGPEGRPALDDPSRCTRCYECVELCPTDALRPTSSADTSTRAHALSHRPGWLSRLAGLPGPSFPAPFPPSYLRPRAEPGTPPRYVLGLAVMTMQEHAAVLLDEGRVVGAIELERVVRRRHAGWHPVGRPGVTAAVDPTLCLEEAFCRPAIRALLEREGITLDDVDLFALNGLAGRHVGHIDFLDDEAEIPIVWAGRVAHVPHHLAHAASVYRAFGEGSMWVLTVDGRGDRECAALWRGEGGRLSPVKTLLSLTDRSVGGVYEGITRALGFGSHGQGSVMALAAFGEPAHDFEGVLGFDGEGLVAHESAVQERFGRLARERGSPLDDGHRDLAASLQAALESAMLGWVRAQTGDGPIDGLGLAGGVTLNCRMNERLRRELAPARIAAQPAANDAGTALGAALEVYARRGGALERVGGTHHGPAFSDDAIEVALKRSRLRYRRLDDVAEEVAAELAEGRVVCFFQGRMELGPRALGARSVLADPRRAQIHARVNGMKEREPWRPFGPSILAGHEEDWLEGAFDARHMLFTLPVKEAMRERIPAVVHVDGTTRPQVVHADELPLYHALIAAFHRRTGVPMLLNTSFNRRGEPIVCTPEDAVEAFVGLEADLLSIGGFLVERERRPIEPADEAALRAAPGGRRLALRLSTACDFECGHCPLRDQWGRDDRPTSEARHALEEGRRAGCDELVILRGEAALRPDLPALVREARAMGYRFVQLQTNAHALADPRRRSALVAAGVDAFEVTLLAPSEPLHDLISGAPGTYRATLGAIRALAASGKEVWAVIPVLEANARHLGGMVRLAHRLGLRRVQLNFPRPVETEAGADARGLLRLAQAAHFVRRAAAVAAELGVALSTEAFPHCHLPASLRRGPESEADWARHRVDDLHLLHESLAGVRATQRPDAPPCRSCGAREACPRTWALYLELFGSDELRPLDDRSPAKAGQ